MNNYFVIVNYFVICTVEDVNNLLAQVKNLECLRKIYKLKR